MSKYFFRICILISSLFFQDFFSQKHDKIDIDKFSDGKLIINDDRAVEVKIFTTTSVREFVSFAQNTFESNILIILNKSLNEYSRTSVFDAYKVHDFQVLDDNLRPVEKTFYSSYKYLYIPISSENRISPNDHLRLDKSFKIWNPSTGFKLGPINLHYYSLMFVIAFSLGYFLMKRIFIIDNIDKKYLESIFTWTLIGTILGARLGHVIFYQPELFKRDFWAVFLPIQTNPEFKFTGFSGLASHGAAIALIFTTLYYSYKIIRKNPFWVYDRLGIVVALGGAFVRIGNFFNSEIIGKPTPEGSVFAILFPQQSSEYGVSVPRYPSQLFESVGYVLLFVILWYLYRKTDKKYQQGWLFGLFFTLLWAIRFFVEFLKEPQGEEFIQFAGLNTGQILSIPFMIAGIGIMFYSTSKKMRLEIPEK